MLKSSGNSAEKNVKIAKYPAVKNFSSIIILFYFCEKMASGIPPKRSRATAEQLNQMVDFLLRNPGLAGNKFVKLHGKCENVKKWSELAVVLNSIGGAIKTVDQWCGRI